MSIVKPLQINKFILQAIIVYFIFAKPGFMEDVPVLDVIWNAGRFGLTIVFMFLLLFIKPKRLKGVLFPLLIFIVELFSTFLHDGVYSLVLSHWVPIIGIIAWICYYQDNVNKIIKYFFLFGEFLILLNGIIMLLFPDGLWIRGYNTPIWLLGQKQDFGTVFLSTSVFGLVYFQDNRLTKKDYAIIIIGVLSLIKVVPLGLIVCLSILFFVYSVDRFIKIGINSLFKVGVWAHIIALVLASVIELFPSIQQLFLLLPSTGMDKLQTMSVRFKMWLYALDTLKESPLIGRGQVTEEIWYQTSKLDFYHTIVHNTPLDIALVGGGIALCLFMIWNIVTVRKLQRNANNPKVRSLGIGLFALVILFITECPYLPLIFSIYGFSFFTSYVNSAQ